MSRAASLRRQLDLMQEVRDRIYLEGEGTFDRWMDALVPLTDKLIDELHEAESTATGQRYNPWHDIHGMDIAMGPTWAAHPPEGS